MARRTLKELIELHEAKARDAERKAEAWAAKSKVARNRAEALKAQVKEAAE